MTTTQASVRTLERLLDRAKATNGPDRILDRDIARVVMNAPTGWLHPCISAWGGGVPHYTRSFEAAVTLLPPLVLVEISISTDTFQPGVWPAVSLRWLPPGITDPKKWWGTVQGGPTFALAMCRASLDMRRAQATREVTGAVI